MPDLLLRVFGAYQSEKLIGLRETPGLLLRENLLAIEENVQSTGTTSTQSDRNTQLAFQVVLEAHGLSFDVASKETALDLDGHQLCCYLVQRTGFSKTSIHRTLGAQECWSEFLAGLKTWIAKI